MIGARVISSLKRLASSIAARAWRTAILALLVVTFLAGPRNYVVITSRWQLLSATATAVR